jgi:hypothetical protein
MFWITAKMFSDDRWWLSLSSDAEVVFGLCVGLSSLRTDLPGLLSTDAHGIAAKWKRPVELVERALEELCLPDKHGLQHFFYDPDAMVVRVRGLPKHQRAANENIIRGWFRRWRDIPECRLKYDHIESLSEGINFNNPGHERVWAETFGLAAIHGLPSGSRPTSKSHTQSTDQISVSDPDPDPVCVSVSVSVDSPVYGKPTNVVEFPQKATRGVISDGTWPAQLRGPRAEHAGVTGSGPPDPAREEPGGGEPREIVAGPRTLGGNILPPGYE